ncbi:hypothetical protein [Mesorhizobium sp.]|uniref:hypothetical protein n=1 Tax=Mesorhizobium sp. TaxID=1871066 RepID=UPI002579DB69|nr:hypothetical protein [Mesorhizobium sp.]
MIKAAYDFALLLFRPQQVLLYALIPLFVYVVAAFLIAAMDPELTKVSNAANQRRLQLSDISAFLLLCGAGTFVLINIQILAQGIVGGVAAAIGSVARTVGRYTGLTVPMNVSRAGIKGASIGFQGSKSLYTRFRGNGGPTTTSGGDGAKAAMQNRISSHSMPR